MRGEGGGGGNVWSRRVGPLPMWGWAGIGLLAVVVLYMYRKNKTAASSSTSTDTSGNAPGGVDASLVPQFVNQVYTQTQPPAAPNVTVNNQIPPETPPPASSTPPPNQAPHTVHQYPAPQGVKASKAGPSSLNVSFSNLTSPQPAPQSYTVAVFDKEGKRLAYQTVSPDAKGNKTTATVTGLPKNDQDLTVRVWANGGAIAPPGTNVKVNLLCLKDHTRVLP